MGATLTELAAWLTALGGPEPAPGTLLRGEGNRRIERLGLALDYAPELDAGSCDAVLLHRPWRLPAEAWPGLGVLSMHEGFERALLLAENPALARELGFRQDAPLCRAGQAVGMLGELTPPCSEASFEQRLLECFGGLEVVFGEPPGLLTRVATTNVFSAAIVAQAAERGAQALVTGQLRAPGRGPARERGVLVFAVGPRRLERHALKQLALRLQAAFPGLSAVVLGGARAASLSA